MPDNEIKKIIDEIEKSGYPLELFVMTTLQEKNIEFEDHIPFDFNGKLFEIDISASFEDFLSEIEGNHFQFTQTRMLIECKKSITKPWVFFSHQGFDREYLLDLMKYKSGFDSLLKKINYRTLLGEIQDKLVENHYLSKTPPKCIGYLQAFRNPSIPNDIYKAIQQVLSYLTVTRESSSNRQFDCRTEIFYPIIVLDGHLYEARMEENQVNLCKKNHVQLRINYSDETFLIDILQKDTFKSFLNQIEKDHSEFKKLINQIELTPEIREALKNNVENFWKKIVDR